MHLGINSAELVDGGGSWFGGDGWGGGGDFWGTDQWNTSGGYPGIVPPRGGGGIGPWIQTGIDLIGRAIGGGVPAGGSACGPEPSCSNPPCWDKLKADILPGVVAKVRSTGVPDVVFWYGDLLLVDAQGCFQRVGRAGSVDAARQLAAQLGQTTCLTFQDVIYCPEGTRPAPPVTPGVTPPYTPPFVPPGTVPPVSLPPGRTATTGMDTGTMIAIGGGLALALWAVSRRGRS